MNIVVVILLGLLLIAEFISQSLMLRLIFKVEDFIKSCEREDK